MKKGIATLIVVGVLSLGLKAGELEGVPMPDQVTVGEHVLKLNGMGLRLKKVAFIKVKVYVAGLYLETPSKDPAKILNADETRRIVMHFLYKEVDRKKLVDAWIEGFESNSPKKADALKPKLERFNKFWPTMKKGEDAVLTYVPGEGTHVSINGEEVGIIEGKDFADALFAVWLGAKPPNADLKKGLLGR